MLGTTPILLVGEGGKHALVISNQSGQTIQVGASGTLSTLGMDIPDGTIFADNYSQDEYWAKASSSSGTVSGFVVC